MKRTKEERERLLAQAKLLDRNGWSAPEISRKIGVPEFTIRVWTGEVVPQKFDYVGPVCIHTDEASTEVKEERIPYYEELATKSLPLVPRELRERLECAS